MPRTLLMLVLSTLATANEPKLQPGPLEGTITGVVAVLVENQHLEGARIDDAVSAAWFDAYVDSLDPQRLYFLKSDIDEFSVYRTQLDDTLHARRPSDLDAAYRIWDRYLQRFDERTAHAKHLLQQPVDFTVDETWDTDRSDAAWATTTAESNELWRKYIKEQLLLGELWGREHDDHVKRLVERYDETLQSYHELEEIEVLEMYLDALTGVHDPHSGYFAPARQANFDIDLSQSVEGIGAVLRTEKQYTKVVELIAGGPAATSGALHPEDRIIAVAQGSGEPVDVIDQRIDKVVRLIRGKKGTQVRLTVIPQGEPDSVTRVVTLTRDRVKLEEMVARLEMREVPGPDRALNVAVIEVPSFYAPIVGSGGASRVTADVEAFLAGDAHDADAVIIDLRRNSGGSLSEAVDLTGLFIDRGPVVQVRGREDAIDVYVDRKNGVAWDGPLVVLTSPLSASASEIFAGAIQDYGRGLIVGAKHTHGKGTVQTVIPLDRMLGGMVDTGDVGGTGMLKLTTQQFYRIDGDSTQDKGIEADVEIPYYSERGYTYERELPHALEWGQVKPASYRRVGDFSPALAELRAQSAARLAADPVFQKQYKVNAWLEAHADIDEVSLKLETRKAEYEEREALVAESTGGTPPEAPPADAPEGEIVDGKTKEKGPDPVLDEALRVTADLFPRWDKLAGF